MFVHYYLVNVLPVRPLHPVFIFYLCSKAKRRNARSQLHRCTTKSKALSATIQIHLVGSAGTEH
jgi:hypothetical protein